MAQLRRAQWLVVEALRGVELVCAFAGLEAVEPL
jgi:hypothetical protein